MQWLPRRWAATVEALAAAGVVVVAAAMGSATSGPAAAGSPPRPRASQLTCTPPGHLAPGQFVVPIVVDFGGPGGAVVVTCVVAVPGESGEQVLAGQAAALGDSPPRYNDAGLLCAIDGYPTTGCGTQSGAHYAYWSYWHGGAKWQYASGGPAAWKVTAGDVEGWRFEPDGSATPADSPPRAASAAAALEVQRAPVPTTTSTTVPSTSTTTTGTGDPATSVPGATATPASTLPRATTTTRPSTAASTTTAPSHPSSTSRRNAAGPVHGAGGDSGAGPGSGGTSPVPFGVGAVVLLLVAGGAFLRARHAAGRAS